MAETSFRIPPVRRTDTQAVLAECAKTRKELRAVMEQMRATLSSARDGLQEANRGLASATARVRATLDR